MSKQLTIDEMMEAALLAKLPGADEYIDKFEELATALAVALAEHLGVRQGIATFQPGFGGTCAPFYQFAPDQECPEAIQPFDEEEWNFATLEEIAETNVAGKEASKRDCQWLSLTTRGHGL